MKPRALRFAVLAIALASACTQSRVMTLAPAPADLFDPTAPVEVAGAQTVAGRHGHVVAGAGEGAGTGMAAGAGGAILGGAQTGEPIGLVLGILLAPVFAVGGGIYGAAAAHPAEETEAAVAAIEQVYADQALLGGLAAGVERQILGLGFPALPPCAAPGSEAATDTTAPAGCAPAPQNRLRMTVTYAFSTRGAYSPELQFAIDVGAVAANADRTREAAAFRWLYLSPELDFFAATSDGAAELRAAIADGQERMAGKIVDDLFLARHEVKVSGAYSPNAKGINFRPAAIAPGAPSRVPTQSELINVPAESLTE